MYALARALQAHCSSSATVERALSSQFRLPRPGNGVGGEFFRRGVATWRKFLSSSSGARDPEPRSHVVAGAGNREDWAIIQVGVGWGELEQSEARLRSGHLLPRNVRGKNEGVLMKASKL